MIHFSPVDSLLIILYFLAVLYVGFRAVRRSRNDSEDFLLAGRTLTLPIFVATLVSTWYGGILGVGEFSYRFGISNWDVLGAPYYVFALLFALFLARRIRASPDISQSPTSLKHHTIAEQRSSAWHIINTLTREIMRVTSVSGTTVNVTREVGSVAKANSVGTADEFVILGYRGAEGDSAVQGFIRTAELIYNFVGEIADGYEVTQYADATNRRYGGKTIAELREDKLEDNRQLVEYSILLDQRAKNQRASDNLWVWTTGGIDSFLTDNETDFNGTLTEDKLITACRSIKRFGPRERWVCASPLFMEKLNLLYVGDRRLNQNVPTEVGVDILTVKYGGLTLHFFEHPMLDDASSTADNGLDGEVAFDFRLHGLARLDKSQTGQKYGGQKTDAEEGDE